MHYTFYKYHGAGNDFIILDNRDLIFNTANYIQIAALCDRHFGIGADGLIAIQKISDADFEMCYYNSDGNRGSMCGNGGRCAVAFAKRLGIIDTETKMLAYDGLHKAFVKSYDSSSYNALIKLQMQDVNDVEENDDFFFINTGSPHYVKFTDNLADTDVIKDGRKIRYNSRFAENGTNVNFVKDSGKGISVRTYERGVENETLSCGTGVTASAIAFAIRKNMQGSCEIPVETNGGLLSVSFINENKKFTEIYLEGPAIFVFEGSFEI